MIIAGEKPSAPGQRLPPGPHHRPVDTSSLGLDPLVDLEAGGRREDPAPAGLPGAFEGIESEGPAGNGLGGQRLPIEIGGHLGADDSQQVVLQVESVDSPDQAVLGPKLERAPVGARLGAVENDRHGKISPPAMEKSRL